jgi:hypothetical protein
MVFRIVTGVESSLELLPESSQEEMRSTSTTLLLGSLLEKSALTSMRVDRFFLRTEEKKHCLSMAGVAGVRQLGPCTRVRLLPRSDEKTTTSMERWGRRTGAAHWDGSSSSLRNLTLLAGAVDNTEEDGRGRGRGASSLQNLSLESRAIPATETRLRQRRGRWKPKKEIEGRRQGRAFINKIRMRKWYND